MKLKKTVFIFCILISAVVTSACGYHPAQASAPTVSHGTEAIRLSAETTAQTSSPLQAVSHGTLAIEHIRHMDAYLYRRPSFTYRELETALWIEETLLEMGFPQAAIEIQEFSLADVRGRLGGPYEQFFERAASMGMFADRSPRRYSQNVILTIPGRSAEKIVIGAHYDTDGMGWGHGASDNASGVALLLESAQRMRGVDHYHTLVYVFFGAEELATGLLGSYYYFNALSRAERENIAFMVNADVLFEGPYLVYVAGVLEGQNRVDNDLTRSWDRLAAEVNVRYGTQFISYPQGMSRFKSDHIIFFEGGVPVIYLGGLDRGATGTLQGRFLDTPYDNLAHIEATSPGLVARNMWAFSMMLEAVLLGEHNGETPKASSLPFTDVRASAWYYPAVSYVFERGLMLGTSSTTFSPQTGLDRAMLATILWRFQGEPEVNFRPIFQDVSAGNWYSEAITWAYENDIIRGVGGNHFAPNNVLSRQELAAMMYRLALRRGYDVTVSAHITDTAAASWAIQYVRWAVYHGLIPAESFGQTATRAETANALMLFSSLSG